MNQSVSPLTEQGQVAPAIDRKSLRHRYSKGVLTVLSICCAAAFITVFAAAAATPPETQGLASTGWYAVVGPIAVLVLMGVAIAVLISDWRGYVTINGAVHWGKLPVWARWVLGYFALGLWLFVLPLYLLQAWQTYRYFEKKKPAEMRFRMATLESQLGHMPPAAGTCRQCLQPLQVGAEFCAYCGVAVIPRAQVCPNCATTTFPDAKWCPNCHQALEVS